jgi:hypothetical protein
MKRCLLMVWFIPLLSYAQSSDEIRDSLRMAPIRPEAMAILATIHNPLDFLPEMVAAVEKEPKLLACFTSIAIDNNLWYPDQVKANNLAQFIPGILDIFNHPPDSSPAKDFYTALCQSQQSAYILSFPGMPMEAADGFRKMLPKTTAVRGLINRNIAVDTSILRKSVSNYDFVEAIAKDGHIDLLKPYLSIETICSQYLEEHHTNDLMINHITPIKRIQVENKWVVLLKYQVAPESNWHYALVGAFPISDPFSDLPPLMSRCTNDSTSLIQKADAYYKADYSLGPYIP